FSRQCVRRSWTSRKPMVIWVGRNSLSGTGFRTGSRTAVMRWSPVQAKMEKANILEGNWLARSGFGLSSWPHDVVAGVTVAAIALPEQRATARLGHFPPQIGLLAFVAASLGFFAFGTSRTLSVGADSTITPIFAGTLLLVPAAASSQTAALLALMVGVIV